MSDNESATSGEVAADRKNGGCLLLAFLALLIGGGLCHRGCSLQRERERQESAKRLEEWRAGVKRMERARPYSRQPMAVLNLPRYFCPVCGFERPFWHVKDTDLLECDTCGMRTTYRLLSWTRCTSDADLRRQEEERILERELKRRFPGLRRTPVGGEPQTRDGRP